TGYKSPFPATSREEQEERRGQLSPLSEKEAGDPTRVQDVGVGHLPRCGWGGLTVETKLFLALAGVLARLILAQSCEGTAPASPGAVEILVLWGCLTEAKLLVDAAYNQTQKSIKQGLLSGLASPMDLLSYFKQPVAATRTVVWAANYMHVALGLLEEKVLLQGSRSFSVTGTVLPIEPPGPALAWECANGTPAATAVPGQWLCTRPRSAVTSIALSPGDATTSGCQGLHPIGRRPWLGASNQALVLWLPAEYEDGLSLPFSWTPSKKHNGFRLPLVWAVSNQIMRFPSERLASNPGQALMFMQWGQFVNHDLDFSPESPARVAFTAGVDCEKTCAQLPPCFPIKILPNDPRTKNQKDCIPFFCSAPSCPQNKNQVRNRLNVLTSFVDASVAYGSEVSLALRLRHWTNYFGLLAVNQQFHDNGRALLPFNTLHDNPCLLTNRSSRIPCFLAGQTGRKVVSSQDTASSWILGLGSHAETPKLAALHTLFMREHNWLATQLRRLNPRWSRDKLYQEARKIVGAMVQACAKGTLGPYRGYCSNVDPRVANVFTLAFRFGHTVLQPFMFRLDTQYRAQHPTRMSHLAPPSLPAGELCMKLNCQDSTVLGKLWDRLFLQVRRIELEPGGNQHATQLGPWPPTRFCGLSQPPNLAQLSRVLKNQDLARKFVNLYGTPDNTDIWFGAIADWGYARGLSGASSGLFWWQKWGVFIKRQCRALRQASLSRIVCDNTGITTISRHIFTADTYPRGFVSCSRIPKLNLSAC
ncbi:hypothetical protein HPG69_003078, partial [Diceros bicornis minor]